MIFIPLMRDEYGIHPSKIMRSADRGNISTVKGYFIPVVKHKNNKSQQKVDDGRFIPLLKDKK